MAKVVYRNERFSVVEEWVELPNGRKAKVPFVKRSPATIIVAVKNEKILLIKEYRAVLKRWIYGLPGGKLEKSETPLMGAKRELKEETGYEIKKIVQMFRSSLNPSYIDQFHYFFFAELGKKRKQKLDEDEAIITQFISKKEALKMIKTGKLIDLLSIAGILYYLSGY